MTFLYTIIVLVIVFDFINGFHDSANSIATVVSTRVLSPFAAVILAASFNFLAFFIFDLKVVDTIGKKILDPSAVNLTIICAGLLGAIVWNLLTWWWGLPSSSSHALIGGMAGGAIAGAGMNAVVWATVGKVFLFIIISPVVGFALAWIISGIVILLNMKNHPKKVDGYFRQLQLLSAAAFSLGHGGNDAQKSMGIILAAMMAAGEMTGTDKLPFWVVISCYSAMGFGTLFGGWKIVKTMGQKITKLKPFEGFCAESSGALTLFGASFLGVPVSTTHTITGAIFGVGSRNRAGAVKWGVARNILWAWVLTIPAAGTVAALSYGILKVAGL